MWSTGNCDARIAALEIEKYWLMIIVAILTIVVTVLALHVNESRRRRSAKKQSPAAAGTAQALARPKFKRQRTGSTKSKLQFHKTWRYFLSHKQSEAGPQARVLAYELTGDKGECWLDVLMHDKSEEAMQHGVEASTNFVCILTAGYLRSEYCLKELRWAHALGKPIIPCFPEGANVGTFLRSAPADLAWVRRIECIKLLTSECKVSLLKIRARAAAPGRVKLHTVVVSAFPGIGKSWFARQAALKTAITVVDLDSNDFPRAAFPQNYVARVRDLLGIADVVLVSTHPAVRAALLAARVRPFVLVYPDASLKDEYLARYARRDENRPGFRALVASSWDAWQRSLRGQQGCAHVVLRSGEFLSTVQERVLNCGGKREAAGWSPASAASGGGGEGGEG